MRRSARHLHPVVAAAAVTGDDDGVYDDVCDGDVYQLISSSGPHHIGLLVSQTSAEVDLVVRLNGTVEIQRMCK